MQEIIVFLIIIWVIAYIVLAFKRAIRKGCSSCALHASCKKGFSCATNELTQELKITSRQVLNKPHRS